MHILVASSDPQVFRLFSFLCREMGWELTPRECSYRTSDIEQLIAYIPDNPADVIIVQENNALILRLCATGPHLKPIIGCTDYYTPDFERRMLQGRVWPVSVLYAFDELIEVIEVAASTQMLQHHIRLHVPMTKQAVQWNERHGTH